MVLNNQAAELNVGPLAAILNIGPTGSHIEYWTTRSHNEQKNFIQVQQNLEVTVLIKLHQDY